MARKQHPTNIQEAIVVQISFSSSGSRALMINSLCPDRLQRRVSLKTSITEHHLEEWSFSSISSASLMPNAYKSLFFIAEREILNSSFRWRHGATSIKGCATSSTESRIQYLMLYESCTWFLLDWCGKIWGRPSMVFIHTACCLTKKLHLSVWNLLLLIFMLVTPLRTTVW